MKDKFITNNVNNFYEMFYTCKNLKTIYVKNDFDTSNATNTGEMYSYCYKLVGGAGTKLSYEYNNATYSRIDGGPTNPGYFTLRTD